MAWYFDTVYGTLEGPNVSPFYCDPSKVGPFAVSQRSLADGDEETLFQLFVALTMFQGVRDVVVMRRQLSLTAEQAAPLLSLPTIQGRIESNRCRALGVPGQFEARCNVWKNRAVVDCDNHPGRVCHVKDATSAFRRMGDMGKLPTSAWLGTWRIGMKHVLGEARAAASSPRQRAFKLAERFAKVHRVGEKLATMYVSALSTPALAPGLTPWFPEFDGNDLVVVDTNVARAVDMLRGRVAGGNTERQRWLRAQASQIDLRVYHQATPSCSPRLVQQALYWFLSKSNRKAAGDRCANPLSACERCVQPLCPFATPA